MAAGNDLIDASRRAMDKSRAVVPISHNRMTALDAIRGPDSKVRFALRRNPVGGGVGLSVYEPGWYCGPRWGEPGVGPRPFDAIDVRCMIHDACYGARGYFDKSCDADASGRCTVADAEFPTLGEAIFNLGYTSKFAGGAYSCARCHTKGWSYGQAQVPGGGAMGPNMTGGSEIRQFATATQQEAYVAANPKVGSAYGSSGWSTGRMPSFGVNPNSIDPKTATMSADQVMLTPEQIAAVVAYERSL